MKNVTVLAVFLLAAFQLCGAGAPQMSETAKANFSTQLENFYAFKENRTPVQRKIDTQILMRSSAITSPQAVARLSNALVNSYVGENGCADCNVKCTVSDRLVELIKAKGGTVISVSQRFGAIHAKIPFAVIEAIAADPDVTSIKKIWRGMTNKNTTSEGVKAHRADTVQSSYGVTGAGVNVGVISDGCDDLYSLQRSGDLPSNVQVLSGRAGSGYEGGAMMEIVHDMAPNAGLAFANCGSSCEEFGEAILALFNAGCKVVVDDMAFLNDAAFEDGPISQAINEMTKKGGVYVTCACNSGAYSRGTSCVWEGDFSDSGAVPFTKGSAGYERYTKDYVCHQFSTDPILVQTGMHCVNTIEGVNEGSSTGKTVLCLQWADKWGKSANDYDFFVADPRTGTLIVAASDDQNGKGDPIELVEVSNAVMYMTTPIVAVVKKTSSAARFFRFEVTRGRLGTYTNGSIYGHHANENAITCAAAAAPSGRAFTANDPLEDFSSDGPGFRFYKTNGTAYKTGTVGLFDGGKGGGVEIKKPDVTAADSVSCSANGFENFPGTSAAAPHCAAIAALMLEANPSLTAAKVKELMTKSTMRTTVSWDRDYGYGILDAAKCVQAARNEPQITYSVTYKPGTNGTGTQVTDKKTKGRALTLRGATFTRTGYVQTGWSKTDGGAQAYALGASYTTDSALTLYPVWTAEPKCDLAFLTRSQIAGTNYEGWEKTMFLSADVPTGFAYDPISEYEVGATPCIRFLIGNLGDADASTVKIKFEILDSGGQVKNLLNRSSEVSVQSMCFIALHYQWDAMSSLAAGSYRLRMTLDSDGTSGSSSAANKVATYDFTVKAKAAPYSIRFIRNDGSGAMETKSFPYGVTTALPTLDSLGWARRGYTFTGWYTSPANIAAGKNPWKTDGGTVASPTAAGKQMDAYARWELKTGYYQIKFYKNDGTDKWRSLAYEYGKSTALPTGEAGLGWTRAGYEFKGWATSAANAKAGKVWKAGGAKVSAATAKGSTLSVYAVWKELPKYRIRFIRNDGAGTTVTKSFPCTQATALPTLGSLGWARRGYTFTGWYTSTANIAAGKAWKTDGAKVTDATAAERTLDVYAGWKLKSGYYQIKFNKNDGTGKWRSLAYEYGKSTALPTCTKGLGWTRKDYAFGGWATSAANAKAGKVWKADAAKVVTAAASGKTLNVYAIWLPAYSIRFIRNDGAGTMETVELPYGVTTKLPTLNAMVWARRGYTFTGWYTSTANIAAGKVWKGDGGTVASPTAAGTRMDVYAGWMLKGGYYQIKFYKNDGTGKWRTLAYEYGKSTALPTCVKGLGWTRKGYVFGGWATSAANAKAGNVWKPDAAKVATTVAAGQSFSCYAIWKKVSANVVSAHGPATPSPVPDPPSIIPGYYSGLFADGSGTFDLLLGEDGTAFFRAETEDGVWAAECEAEPVDGTLVLIFEDGSAITVACDGLAFREVR